MISHMASMDIVGWDCRGMFLKVGLTECEAGIWACDLRGPLGYSPWMYVSVLTSQLRGTLVLKGRVLHGSHQGHGS